jgi:hypothetical protein
VFRYNPQKKKYTRVATLGGASKLRWTDKGLKANKKYSYKVRAYKKSPGGMAYSPLTYYVSAVTNKASSKRVNAGGMQYVERIQINYNETKTVKNAKTITLGINETRAIIGTALPSKPAQKKGRKVLSKKARLMVTPSGHAAKDSKGRLVGKLPGNANVYLMAHNGYKKKLNVRVVDYAKPAKWDNINEIDSRPAQFIQDCKNDINEVASYFSKRQGRPFGFNFAKNPDGALVIEDDPNVPPSTKDRPNLAGVIAPIKNIIENSPYSVSISVTVYGDVTYILSDPGDSHYYEISFRVGFDTPENTLNEAGITKLAPHWECRKMDIPNI